MAGTAVMGNFRIVATAKARYGRPAHQWIQQEKGETPAEWFGRERRPTTNNPSRQPELEEVKAYKADDSGKLTVILPAQDFRLPEVLRHIEAGRVVLVIPKPSALR
jgi:hypothetical protein